MTVLQRPVKGSRISSFYPVKSVPVLSSLDSAFQLQEYVSLLIRSNVHDVEAIVTMPGKSGAHDRAGSDGSDKDGDKDGKSDVTVDEACWVFEQLRRLAQDLSHPLITTLQQECTRATCPEMKAGEWLYLCVAHGNEGAMEQCCAIDYILHTLDSATALLNSPRAFPSRINVPATSIRHFASLARRLGRIFAHAYYHHREAFEQAEAESSLYARFLALTAKFDLVPNEFLVIPSRTSAPQEDGDDEFNPEYSTRGFSEVAQRLEHERQWLTSGGGLDTQIGRGISPPGPAGEARNPSPRKGRSRTDTMVHSDAVNVVEELAKGESFSEADLDRAIAQERLLSAGDSTDEPASVAVPSTLEPLSTEKEEPPAPDVPESAVEAPEAQEVLSHPTEIHLEIAAPPPAEPAIPGDVEEIEAADEADEDVLTEVLEQEAPSQEPAEASEDVASAEVNDESTQEADVTEDVEIIPEPAEDPVEVPSASNKPEDEAPSAPTITAESDIGVNEESQDEVAAEEVSAAKPANESATDNATPPISETTTTPPDPEHDKPSDSDG